MPFAKCIAAGGRSLLVAKEKKSAAVPAGHESPSGAFKSQTGLRSKCRVFSAARSQRFRRAGSTRKGLLAPFRPQRGSRTGKNLAASLNDFFSVLHLQPLSRCGGSSPKGEPLAKPVTLRFYRKLSRPAKGSPLGRAGFAKQRLRGLGRSPQRRRFHRKQALQMPFAVTTPPVKMGFRKVRRLS